MQLAHEDLDVLFYVSYQAGSLLPVWWLLPAV